MSLPSRRAMPELLGQPTAGRVVTAAVDIRTVRTFGNPVRRVVDAHVRVRGRDHRVGWLPSEQWFCSCARPRSCPQIAVVAALVPILDTATEPF
jgi:hypothetical protein